MQATMARLGSKLPYREAAEEVWYSQRTMVAEATVRRITQRHGCAAEALVTQEVAMLQREAPEASAQPQQVMVSIDGAFVHLTSGDWREVKSMVIGEFNTEWDPESWDKEVKTEALSYFSRSYPIRDFEHEALAEIHRRGVENATTVVAVNDGAEWIQSFLDYHCPQAVRILDFAHAAGYLAQAGKAIWPEESATFKQWFDRACHQLKYEPPRESIANLRLLLPKAETAAQEAVIATAIFYLERRLPLLDYAHFRQQGFPLGSGCVESGHKVVVQRRMKGPGMRWAPHNVDPMLALRNLICNGTWETGWQHIVLFQQDRRMARLVQMAAAKQPPPPTPVTFAELRSAGLLPDDEDTPEHGSLTSSTFSAEHPWRTGKWPTREAWRWN